MVGQDESNLIGAINCFLIKGSEKSAFLLWTWFEGKRQWQHKEIEQKPEIKIMTAIGFQQLNLVLWPSTLKTTTKGVESGSSLPTALEQPVEAQSIRIFQKMEFPHTSTRSGMFRGERLVLIFGVWRIIQRSANGNERKWHIKLMWWVNEIKRNRTSSSGSGEREKNSYLIN